MTESKNFEISLTRATHTGNGTTYVPYRVSLFHVESRCVFSTVVESRKANKHIDTSSCSNRAPKELASLPSESLAAAPPVRERDIEDGIQKVVIISH